MSPLLSSSDLPIRDVHLLRAPPLLGEDLFYDPLLEILGEVIVAESLPFVIDAGCTLSRVYVFIVPDDVSHGLESTLHDCWTEYEAHHLKQLHDLEQALALRLLETVVPFACEILKEPHCARSVLRPQHYFFQPV